MIRSLTLALALALVLGWSVCASWAGTLRMGLARVALAEATSEATILKAVQGALGPSEASCAPKILERGKQPSDGSNGSTERIEFDVCGKRQRYELKWIRISNDDVMVTARGI